jgi:hypothetical protein
MAIIPFIRKYFARSDLKAVSKNGMERMQM